VTTLIEFQLPARLMSMNDRYHWSEQRRLARAWREAAAFHALDQVRPPRLLGPSLVELELPVVGNLRRDPHNYAPTLKHTVDGLVDAGLWPDDTPEHVRTLEPRLVVITRASAQLARVRIHITPRSST
jgi:crossover junction endodeoxyribonuclease RusA